MSGVETPSWQGEETQEYRAYSEFSQRSQVGCIGPRNVKLFLREPLDVGGHMKQWYEALFENYGDAYDREARNGAQWIPAIIMKNNCSKEYQISFLGWGSKYDRTLSVRDIAPRYTKCKKRFNLRNGDMIEILVSEIWKIGQIEQIRDTNIIIKVLESDEYKIHVRNYEYSEIVCPFRTHILKGR